MISTPESASSQTTEPSHQGINFQQNMSEYIQVDRKVFFAAADRNKGVILDQMKPYLDQSRLGNYFFFPYCYPVHFSFPGICFIVSYLWMIFKYFG